MVWRKKKEKVMSKCLPKIKKRVVSKWVFTWVLTVLCTCDVLWPLWTDQIM